jgi:hypothetical protein
MDGVDWAEMMSVWDKMHSCSWIKCSIRVVNRFTRAGPVNNGSCEEKMKPELRCKTSELSCFAARYQYPLQETDLLELRETIKKRGFLTKDELRALARWKAPRNAGHIENNSEEYIKEITTFALSAETERVRIEVLTNLDGVQWPTASVILHFFHKERYPIMDYRALWSVSIPQPVQYYFDFWWCYVEFCRELSDRTNLDMRTLDRALWQYSKEKQNA